MAQEPVVVHAVRVHARIDAGTFHRELDLSLPLSTTLADALPEVLELAQAPATGRPWRMTTAAGIVLDPALPLAETPLEHGNLLLIAPAEAVEAPVVRDSAEALASVVGPGQGAWGAAQVTTVVGITGVGALLTVIVPPALAAAMAAVLALAVTAWRRETVSFALTAIAAAAVAGGAAVGPAGLADAPWSLFAATGAGVAMAVVVGVLGSLPAQWAACVGVLAAMCLGLAAGLLLPASTAAPTLVLSVALVVILAGPPLATTWAGLKVPVVPTAGQSFAASDGDQPDVNIRALTATRVHAGLSLAVAIGAVPAALLLGWEGSVWSQLTCAVFSAAVVVHAARHASPTPAWSLAVVATAALAAVILAAVQTAATQAGAHLAQIALAVIVAIGATTSFLWAPRVRYLEPTRMVWIERAELAALILAIPLLVHCLGIFTLVRGLG